jgi:hypothetical protein
MQTSWRLVGVGLAVAAITACARQESSGPAVAPSAIASGAGRTVTQSMGTIVRQVAAAGTLHGAYFIPASGVDTNGNQVFAGTSSVTIFASSPAGFETCTFEAELPHQFFRVGQDGRTLDHVNGPARVTYQRRSPAFVLLEELSGDGRLNVHLQGALEILIADGENGETWTIYQVGTRSTAEVITGAGRVGPNERDLRCGLRNDAKGDVPRTYIELK